MTILVVGASGTVGGYVRGLASTFSAPLEATSSQAPERPLDITDLEAVRRRLGGGGYQAVINLAAMTDVDRSERELDLAYRLNTIGAANLAIAAREHDVEIVQVSTTAVYGGADPERVHTELDGTAPPNVYAKTKLAGEDAVRTFAPKHYVVRAGWVMGGGREDKKFVGKVADRMLRGEPIQAVNDEWGSPTYALDLVVAIRELLKARAYGLYNFTNSGRASRYDMALEMKRVLRSSSTITPVSSNTFSLPAPRPKNDAARSVALSARGLGHLVRPWPEALAEYLHQHWL